MKFKLIDVQKRGRITRTHGSYTYWIKGEGKWGLTDLVPHLLHVINSCGKHALDGSFSIVYKHQEGKRNLGYDAIFRVERTVDPTLNRVHVQDRGIGFEDVDRYMRAAVEADVKHVISDEERLARLRSLGERFSG